MTVFFLLVFASVEWSKSTLAKWCTLFWGLSLSSRIVDLALFSRHFVEVMTFANKWNCLRDDSFSLLPSLLRSNDCHLGVTGNHPTQSFRQEYVLVSFSCNPQKHAKFT